GSEERSEVGAVHEPHREVQTAVDVAGVVDRNHIRMLQRHDQLGLACEAFAEALVERKRRRDELHGNRPLQAKVVCPEDHAHAAAADQFLDPVAEEVGADVDGRVGVHRVAVASVRLASETFDPGTEPARAFPEGNGTVIVATEAKRWSSAYWDRSRPSTT